MLINDNPQLGGIPEIFDQLEQAKRLSLKDPALSFLQAILKLETGEWNEAIRLLEESAAYESGSFRKNQAHLWLARTQSAIGKKKTADHYYEKVMNGPNTADGLIWKKKAVADKGSYSKRKLKQVSPNFLLVDVNEL
ncbi:tetratricopeptide repeat protein [Leptospira bandrabouensis]|uniref:tetratricopeptide repeat protein n=2 Tax=Leptospira TaxID=171 RepID=UPI001EE8BBA9|nr:hypothetical protein [Leptospira bandrabouensis]MCG6162045.1 hypothetical protein [Leptospira bandrabouensis]